jgi:hypothetical protein
MFRGRFTSRSDFANAAFPRFSIPLLGVLLFIAFGVAAPAFLSAQTDRAATTTPASNTSAAQEFPVTLRQNVVAGKTPVGTKVEAKLTIATFVSGTVIPEGAIFSGQVVDSTAKSPTDPSRLGVRMDSVQWKNGSKPITVYLTPWYYPVQMPQDSDRDDCQTAAGGMGTKCPLGPGMPGSRFPPDALPPPPAETSKSRVAMKDIESVRGADGIALTSTHSNIKLDKTTVYVLAAGDLTPGK